MKKLFIAIFGLFLLCSCGKDLSRGKAETLIFNYFKDKPITTELVLGDENGISQVLYFYKDEYFKDHETDGGNQDPLGAKFYKVYSNFISLADNGLMKYTLVASLTNDRAKRHPQDPTTWYFDDVKFELTKDAAPYIIKEEIRSDFGNLKKYVTVLLAEVSNVEITGISTPSDSYGKLMCSVNCVITYNPSPFGKLLVNNNSLVKNKEFVFVLYDDGWRLQN